MTTEAILHNQVIQKAWQDPSFKAKLVSNPKAAIQEALGVSLPDHINIQTVQETPDQFFLVLPANPVEQKEEDKQVKYYW
ncbi:hypothetical protein J2Z69_001746 [Paenibacillus shirakamiensis]|uniref:NHLP leader peptide family natural product n=1 Tax=Paenibacillus shirakamiensis TaxID=1265935 RepID=A0ABS4JG64_9BACL|nr:NHLP leader peptide family RiPP precursor [Paenibacillus shirakamiensis]MBP2000715.1 hypothetical protein [Paenibacillus shirakamiensis]